LDELVEEIKNRKGNYVEKIKQWKIVSERILSKTQKNKPLQTTKNIDDLYFQANVANAELKKITENIAKKTNGQAGFRPSNINSGLKGKERTLEKINSDYAGDASKILDIAGSKIVYNNVDDLYNALSKISKELDILVFKDRILNPLSTGYRDILMNLKMKNGHIVEFRLHLKEMDEAAEIGHNFYNQRRSLEALSKERVLTVKEQIKIEGLIEKEVNIYEKAWNQIINK
jgi:(p)ppGpp synthase/HD superfamily hydrolase